MMDSREVKDKLLSIIRERKVEDLTVIDVSRDSSVADFFIIMSCRTDFAARAVAEHIEEKSAAAGLRPRCCDGLRDGRWAVLDYDTVMVHVFNRETRARYSLESLWSRGDNVTLVDAG